MLHHWKMVARQNRKFFAFMEEVKRHGDLNTWKVWLIWLKRYQNSSLCLRAPQIQIMYGFGIHLMERTNLQLTQGQFQKVQFCERSKRIFSEFWNSTRLGWWKYWLSQREDSCWRTILWTARIFTGICIYPCFYVKHEPSIQSTHDVQWLLTNNSRRFGMPKWVQRLIFGC